jgi:hypothetical protein
MFGMDGVCLRIRVKDWILIRLQQSLPSLQEEVFGSHLRNYQLLGRSSNSRQQVSVSQFIQETTNCKEMEFISYILSAIISKTSVVIFFLSQIYIKAIPDITIFSFLSVDQSLGSVRLVTLAMFVNS